MTQKILLIREDLVPPFDEGMKLFALRVWKELERTEQVEVLRDDPKLSPRINRLMLVPRAIQAATRFRAQRIIYLPEASITFNSFVRTRLMQAMLPCPVVLVGLQKRRYLDWQSRIIRRIAPERLYVLSQAMAQSLESIGVNSRVLPAAIDRQVFAPAPEQKKALCAKYNLLPDRLIILHVGHIRGKRNISWLLEIQKSLPEAQVVLVGSTTTEAEAELLRVLDRAGVAAIREYIPAIQEVYQLADCYVFPVQAENAAMEIPFSVLEAMATNLPVVTTRFGRLPELFSEDSDFRFADTPNEMIQSLREMNWNSGECSNRAKTDSFDWGRTARALLED